MSIEVTRGGMTLFLIAVSVGQWFMVLSFGCTRSHACCSAASLAAYAINAARLAVGGGTGRCGLIWIGCITGLLAVSRTGVLDSTYTRESWAARNISHPLWSP